MQETNILPTIYTKPCRPSSSSDCNGHHTYQRDSTNVGSIASLSDICSISEAGDIEITDRDLELIEIAEQMLLRERTRKLNHERELLRIRNQMDRVMNLNFPAQMKIKLMQSLTDQLQTKLKSIDEENHDFQEKVLRLERLNSYMTPLEILKNWKKNNNLTSSQSEDLIVGIDNILTMMPNIEDAAQISNNSLLNRPVPEELKELQKMLQDEKTDNIKIESIIVLLKQIIIPLMISIENTKDDHEEMQNIVKAKKKSLEEKLKLIEDFKKSISKNDISGPYKENINPQTLNKSSSSSTKIRDMYMDYEEKSMEMSMSKINMSSTNTTIFQEASNKMSKVFGKIFKSKKPRIPENILTADVLQDLGIQPAPQKTSGRKL